MPVSTECAAALLSFSTVIVIHHIWGEKVLWSAVFIIQNSDKMQYFTIFQDKLHSFNIQYHRSKRGLLAKPVQINQIKSINQYSEPSNHAWTFSDTRSKNFQNHLYGYRFSRLTSANFAVNIKRVTLQHNKEFIVFIFYLMVL